MPDPFDNPRELLAWASDNIHNLKIAAQDLSHAQPAWVVVVDAQTGNKTYKVVLDKALPSAATRWLSEAIVHCRHALDQACVASWQTKNGSLSEPYLLYFPIATGFQDLEGRLKKSPLSDIPAQCIDVIRSVEPWATGQGIKGGNDILTVLNKAAQRKHRVVARMHGSITRLSLAGGVFKNLIGGLQVPLTWDAVKGEIIVGTTTPDGEINVNIQIAAHIVCDGAGPLDGGNVVHNISAIADTCKIIVDDLASASK